MFSLCLKYLKKIIILGFLQVKYKSGILTGGATGESLEH